ncbi:MAG TPA: hypothetical protein VMT21_09375 [Gemmatimonadales bacterium]|nr:hypothetical protein [Gemmatimonadales bacterium]
MLAPAPRLKRLALVFALLAVPSVALGYGVWIHYVAPSEVLKDFKAAPGLNVPAIRTTMLSGATDADVLRFRTWLYGRTSTLKDAGVRAAFLKRYPTPASFDLKAFKEFLMTNPEAQVLGVDSFAAVYRARTRADVAMDPTAPYTPGQQISLDAALRMGSVYPDIDRRNQDRLYRTADGKMVRTAKGDTVPFDPMTLNWGNLTGLSSQASAHMALNHEIHSSDPGVLTVSPWNFVVAMGYPTDSVESFAEANAQMYTDLSYITALGGGPGSDMLSALFAGNAMHYIADVGNPIHDLQVGIKDIYTDATMQYWLGRLKTVFGLLGHTPSRNSIGLDILSNFHTLSENLFQAELQEAMRLDSAGKKDSISPVMKGVLDKFRTGDQGFRRVLTSALVSAARKNAYPEYGKLIAGAVIDSSFEDGATIYRLTREIAVPSLRKAGMRVDFDTVPARRIWEFVRDRNDPTIKAALDTFNIYQGRGLGRVYEALTAWWNAYQGTRLMHTDRARVTDWMVARLCVARLNYLAFADARRADYITLHGGPAR